MGIMREIWMPLLQKYQISCLLSFWQIGIEISPVLRDLITVVFCY